MQFTSHTYPGKSRLRRTHRMALAAMAAASATAVAPSWATPVTISTPFANLENRAANSLGFSPGQTLRVGAVTVTPNGAAGTTGVASHVLPDGSTTTRTINFAPSPLNPGFFERRFADSPELRGDWLLTFTNGADSASRTVNVSSSATQVGFVNSITLSGTSETPTFSWTPPPDTAVNAYRINIYDRALRVGSNSGQVLNRDLAPGTTSYTINPADFSVPGHAFALGRNYVIEIGVIQTRDGTGNSNNTNIQAISRTYADFSPNAGGGPPVNLPVVLEDGRYQFNMAVEVGRTYYIDPVIAVGYDYQIGAGNPNFLTVDLPDNIGDGFYDIYGFDGLGNAVLLAANWDGRRVYNFGAAGLSRFRVLGIETSASLDPLNTTAFVTGLSFTANGAFTGTQTPITLNVPAGVPEPAPLGLLAAAFVGLLWTGRKRQLA